MLRGYAISFVPSRSTGPTSIWARLAEDSRKSLDTRQSSSFVPSYFTRRGCRKRTKNKRPPTLFRFKSRVIYYSNLLLFVKLSKVVHGTDNLGDRSAPNDKLHNVYLND